MEDPNNVYIGRAGVVFIDNARFPKIASPYANSFKCDNTTRLTAIDNYEIHIRQLIADGKVNIEELRGKKIRLLV